MKQHVIPILVVATIFVFLPRAVTHYLLHAQDLSLEFNATVSFVFIVAGSYQLVWLYHSQKARLAKFGKLMLALLRVIFRKKVV